jgi:hypothetical protein
MIRCCAPFPRVAVCHARRRTQMAAVAKPAAAGKPGLEEELPQVHRIRITLTSRNVKSLEKGAPLGVMM